MMKIDWKLVVAIIALIVAVFAGVFWRRPDVVFDERAVEIPLSEPLRKNIENALVNAVQIDDSVTVHKNGKVVGSSSGLPSAKLPDKLLYVNIRNVGHVPSGRIKARLVVPGVIADKELSDAGSAFGSIDQKSESDSTGELSFECANLANHSEAKLKVALWYQQTKPGAPLIEIQDISLGPAREVGSIDNARFLWWDWSGWSVVIGILAALLGASITAAVFKWVGSGPKSTRPNFTAIYDRLRCGWSEGKIGNGPAMQVHATASISTTEDEPIEIVQAHLKGTLPAMFLIPPLVATQGSAAEQTFHFIVQPVVGRRGKPYRGRIILVDKNNNRYESEDLTLPFCGVAGNSGTAQ